MEVSESDDDEYEIVEKLVFELIKLSLTMGILFC